LAYILGNMSKCRQCPFRGSEMTWNSVKIIRVEGLAAETRTYRILTLLKRSQLQIR
jgi:hypothetical protein